MIYIYMNNNNKDDVIIYKNKWGRKEIFEGNYSKINYFLL